MQRIPKSATDDQVVLLDAAGTPRGCADRLTVHTRETALHLAFSTYLFNESGDVLLTRRALGKTTWPGVWTNSCCGHPRPGEPFEDAMRRRIREELGLEVGPLYSALPDFRYRAVDASGLVENEVCPVYVARALCEPRPDPCEVMDAQWVPWSSLVDAVAATPQVYSPWSVLQVPELARRLPGLQVGPPVPDASRCLDDVAAAIDTELVRLESVWGAHAGRLCLDVLPHDLLAWLRSQLRDGKRLRVLMAYWGFVASGGTSGPAYDALVRVGAALEMLHQFALVHDDVMDGSDARRGRPSAHVEASTWHAASGADGDHDLFGRNLAILVGDLAHTVADGLADGLPTPLRDAWYALCLELIAGQRGDLTGAAVRRHDLGHAREVARLKSGAYTVTRPLELGALAAGATPEALDALRRAGEQIGQAFAYRDDVLGVWGDPALTGKPAGDDLAEAKATVILGLAHERLTGDDLAALGRLGTDAMRPGDVPHLQRALDAAGVREQVETMITAHMDAAAAHLEASALDAAGVRGLTEAARAAAWRQR